MKRILSIGLVALLAAASAARPIDPSGPLKARALMGAGAAARLEALRAAAGTSVTVTFTKTARGVEVVVAGPTRSAVAAAMAGLAREARSAGIDFETCRDDRTEIRAVAVRPITLDNHEARVPRDEHTDGIVSPRADPSAAVPCDDRPPPLLSAGIDACPRRGPPRA